MFYLRYTLTCVYLRSMDDTGGYEFVCVCTVCGELMWLWEPESGRWLQMVLRHDIPPPPLKTIPPPAPQNQPLNGCRVAGKSINIFHLSMRYFQ